MKFVKPSRRFISTLCHKRLGSLTNSTYFRSHDEIQARIGGNGNVSLIDNDEEITIKREYVEPTFWTSTFRLIERDALYIFWQSLYTLVLLAVFAERAYRELNPVEFTSMEFVHFLL